ncbi:Uncharacterised protein [uncultured archaeon]|nr:Uncharacterised protein [uncultured archaeon]
MIRAGDPMRFELGPVPYIPENKFEYVTLDQIDERFHCKAALIRDLRAAGFQKPQALRYQIEEGVISKTSRGIAAINVYTDQDMVTTEHRTMREPVIINMAARYLVKQPIEGEVTVQKWAASRDMAPLLLSSGSNESDGEFLIESYERYKSGLVDSGKTLTMAQAEEFGKTLGRHVATMVDKGTLYDFGRRPFTHTRVNPLQDGTTEVHLIDWGNAIRLQGRQQADVDALLLHQFRDIAIMCRMTSYVTGPRVWQAFTSEFVSHVSPAGRGDARTWETARVRGHRERLWAQELVQGTVDSLLSVEDARARRSWSAFFQRASGQRALASRELRPQEREEVALSELVHERLRDQAEGLDRSATEITRDAYARIRAFNEEAADEDRLNPLRMGVRAQRVNFEGKDVIEVTVNRPEPRNTTFLTYYVFTGADVQRKLITVTEGVGRKIVYADDAKTQLVMRKQYEPISVFRDAPAHVAEELGEGIAVLLARAARRGFTLRQHYENDLLVNPEGGWEVKARNLEANSMYDPDAITEQVKAAASLCRSMSLGLVAWKTFSLTLPPSATTVAEEAIYREALGRAEHDLCLSSSGWKQFFDDARVVMWDNPEVSNRHRQFLEYKEEQDPLVLYDPSNLSLLMATEPVAAQVIETFRRMGMVDCPWRSIPHFHVGIPIREEPHENLLADARMGKVDFTQDYSFLIEVGRYEWRTRLRNESVSDTRYLIPVRDGRVQTPIPLSAKDTIEDKGYIFPADFDAYLVPSGEGMSYSFSWDERAFAGMPPALEDLSRALGTRQSSALTEGERDRYLPLLRRITHEQRLSATWETVEQTALSEYTGSWRPMLAACRRTVDGMEDFDDRYRFLVGVDIPPRVADEIGQGLVAALDPQSPKLLAKTREERGEVDYFQLYREIPEALDATIAQSYPLFRENIELLLTSQKALPKVRNKERELGRHLTPAEYVELVEGEQRVILKGDRPSEYIRRIRYMQNLSRYVLYMSFNVVGERDPHEVVVKRDNLASDLVISSVCEVLGHKTSRSLPVTLHWGLEEFARGQTPVENPAALLSDPVKADRVVRTAGEYAATIISIPVHPHAGNFILDERAQATLIDLEVENVGQHRHDLYPDLGYHIGWGVMPLLELHPEWNPQANPDGSKKVWRLFKEGLEVGHKRYLQEREHVQQLIHEGVVSGALRVSEEGVMTRLDIPPASRLKDTVLYVVEAFAAGVDFSRSDSLETFWDNLPPFWKWAAEDAGVRSFDVRWQEVVDDTTIGREILQQQPDHIALRGAGRLEDWERAAREAERAQSVWLRPQLREGEERRGIAIFDKKTGKFLRYAYEGD